jgi:HEPN domain-containing protein
MQTNNPDFLLNEADQLLNMANEEMCRSEEDVAAYMICQNSRKALKNFMTYFLFRNGVEPKQPVTLENLKEQCSDEDGRFQEVDLSPINCRHDEGEEEYCLSVHKVGQCLEIAQLVRGIVADPVPGY